MPLSDIDFWQLTFLAAVNAGWPADEAEAIADSALEAIDARFGENSTCH